MTLMMFFVCFISRFVSDADECDLTRFSRECLNGATCLNTVGSFICSCAANYTGRTCKTGKSICFRSCDTYTSPTVRCLMRTLFLGAENNDVICCANTYIFLDTCLIDNLKNSLKRIKIRKIVRLRLRRFEKLSNVFEMRDFAPLQNLFFGRSRDETHMLSTATNQEYCVNQ